MFTIGADPEIFLTRAGKAVSGHGTIPGTKRNPYPVDEGAIQVDGTALEFNIDPIPLDGSNATSLWKRCQKVMGQLQRQVGTVDSTLEFNLSSVQEYTDEDMATFPRKALDLGCDPDYNAYTLAPNPRPDRTGNIRTAAGHIHVGWDAGIPADHPEHVKICADFVQSLDLTVGMFMTIIDTDPRRRELYGKAGAFRPKSYGVEYRTPSNVWLKSGERAYVIYELTRSATTHSESLKKLFSKWTRLSQQDIVNEGDYGTAYDWLRYLRERGYIGDNVWNCISKEYKLRVTPEGEVSVKNKKKSKAASMTTAFSTTYNTATPGPF